MLGALVKPWASRIVRFQQNKFPTEGAVAISLQLKLLLLCRKQPLCLRDLTPKAKTNNFCFLEVTFSVLCLFPTDLNGVATEYLFQWGICSHYPQQRQNKKCGKTAWKYYMDSMLTRSDPMGTEIIWFPLGFPRVDHSV